MPLVIVDTVHQYWMSGWQSSVDGSHSNAWERIHAFECPDGKFAWFFESTHEDPDQCGVIRAATPKTALSMGMHWYFDAGPGWHEHQERMKDRPHSYHQMGLF